LARGTVVGKPPPRRKPSAGFCPFRAGDGLFWPSSQGVALGYRVIAPLARVTLGAGCRGRDTGCPAPPSQIPAGGFPAPGSSTWHVVFAHRKVGQSSPVALTGTGCLCGLRQAVGPFSSLGAGALPLDTMNQSDSRIIRRRFLSLRLPSCLALAVSAAGTLRASFVPCVSFSTRHALRPRQTLDQLTIPLVSVSGTDFLTPSPFAFNFLSRLNCFSRMRLLLAARAFPWVRFSPVVRSGRLSTVTPPAEQPWVLGNWLGFSIHHFRQNSGSFGRQTRGTRTPGCTRLPEAHQKSKIKNPI